MTPEEKASEIGNAAVGIYLARLGDMNRSAVAAAELAIRGPRELKRSEVPEPKPPDKCPKYSTRITKETWDLAERKWREIRDKGESDVVCPFCLLFEYLYCQECPLTPDPVQGCEEEDHLTECCDGLYDIWDNRKTPENARPVLAFIREKRAEWERATQRPGPCPKCGAIPESPGGMRVGMSEWMCGSEEDGESFTQSSSCWCNQLAAACTANGLMNGRWPVVVGSTVWFWADKGKERKAVFSSRISAINRDGTVTLDGGWKARTPDKLWHSQAEAEGGKDATRTK